MWRGSRPPPTAPFRGDRRGQRGGRSFDDHVCDQPVRRQTISISNIPPPLPAISQPVTIDGGSQVDGTGIGIELDGGVAPFGGAGIALAAGADEAVVEGLAIFGFGSSGIDVGAPNVKISGNYIGLRADGATVAANAVDGVHVTANDVTVGGLAAGAGNVITGHTSGAGIAFVGVTGGLALQNLIGVAADRTTAAGNDLGIQIAGSSSITIGDNAFPASTAARNVIAANDDVGVLLSGTSVGNVIASNWIGLDAAGGARERRQRDPDSQCRCDRDGDLGQLDPEQHERGSSHRGRHRQSGVAQRDRRQHRPRNRSGGPGGG